jgi:hypothetical protein
MSIEIPSLARAYDLLYPGERWDHPPTSRSLRRIRQTLSIELPQSLIDFTRQSGACRNWLASLGEDFDSPLHILHVYARVRRIRRRALHGGGRWEYVKPPGFVPINHGHDADFDCLDTSEKSAESGEFPIQYWSPPRILGPTRNTSFSEYMEETIRAWAANARQPIRDRVFELLSNRKSVP